MDALRLVDSFELLDIDAEKFFGPISQQAGSGASIQYDKIYDDIKEARRGDDSSLPQGVWETPLKKSDWREVIRLCIYGIQEESKDLQLA
ncbi:MAG: type VI secretion system protein TssA, partial [Gammaproteobacteria bacterium]|nr:type VI secretion system protein TssA [Gammaproteobacteria bacterium]